MKTPGSSPSPENNPVHELDAVNGDGDHKPGVFLERLQNPTSDDITAINALWHDCNLITANDDAGRDIANCLNSGRGSVILTRTENDAVIIGTVMVGHDQSCGWVHYLAVTPAARGTGLGAALLTLAEDILTASGQNTCNVTVEDPTIRDFYRRFGYKTEKPVSPSKPQTPETQTDFVVMRKRLKS
ncbi:GNAT family N-acetyltransferase [Thalassospira alkalitolerans]|uniref:GNAT family N-acetyltransferase n=1 Tax=Thalassospira alkalitolerans TaxID=1293890 RepID=UPI003AA93208